MGEVVRSVASVNSEYSKEEKKEGINTHERSVGAAGAAVGQEQTQMFSHQKSFRATSNYTLYPIYAR